MLTSPRVVFLLAVAALATAFDSSQAEDLDPRTEPIPVLDTINTCKSFVVRLKFNSYYDVSHVSTKVVRGCPPERVGGPPQIGLKLTSSGGCDIETIPAWHPLWTFVYGDDSERLDILPSGEGRFIIPFYRRAHALHVIDIPTDRELIAVNLNDAIRAYCTAHSQDMDCAPTINLSDRLRLIYSIQDFPVRVFSGQDLPQRTARFCDAGGTGTGTGGQPAGAGLIDIVLVPVAATSQAGSSRPESDFGKAERQPASLRLVEKSPSSPQVKPGGAATSRMDLRIPESAEPGWYCLKITSVPGKEKTDPFEEQGNCQLVEVAAPVKAGNMAE